MQRHWILWGFVALEALFVSRSTHSSDIRDVARQFLQRHGVPCPFVLKVDITDNLGEVATCQDGREWILLWVEGEIAFVHPQTREAYKWEREVYRSHPEIYLCPKQDNQNQILVGDGS